MTELSNIDYIKNPILCLSVFDVRQWCRGVFRLITAPTDNVREHEDFFHGAIKKDVAYTSPKYLKDIIIPYYGRFRYSRFCVNPTAP